MNAAKGTHDHPILKLGKKEKQTDKKTVQLADFINRDLVTFPKSYDFDKRHAAFPLNSWGNTNYGDCVVATRANHILRNERVETHRTIKLADEDVVALYKRMTGCVSPGDANDTGLVMLDALRDWRGGWTLQQGTKQRKYSVDAFGIIDHSDEWLIRASIWLFTGIQFGLALPITAQAQTNAGYWRVDDTAPASQSAPGSWGGHAVYAYAYDKEGVWVLTWGRRVKVYNDFIERYADEAWAVVDSLDNWRKTHGVLNVQKLLDYFSQVGINPVQ